MFVQSVLKSSILWFSIILWKLHVWEKSGSWVTDRNALGQLDFSIFQIWISKEPFIGFFWFFAWILVLPILGKNGPKIKFLHFSKKLSHGMFVKSFLKSNLLWFSIILCKLMSGKNLVYWPICSRPIRLLDFSNMNISKTIRPFKIVFSMMI